MNRILHTMNRNKDSTRIIRFSENNEYTPGIDIREYVKSGNDYIPTKKGIFVSYEYLEEFKNIIDKL